jgi:hypothetical protein
VGTNQRSSGWGTWATLRLRVRLSNNCRQNDTAAPSLTRDLFATPHDQANRAAVASVTAAELDFAGIALHADRKTVDKVLDKLRPHP